ncbi:hypothetical protein HDU96_002837, partial [Phlyctochytrium bullatum]
PLNFGGVAHQVIVPTQLLMKTAGTLTLFGPQGGGRMLLCLANGHVNRSYAWVNGQSNRPYALENEQGNQFTTLVY